MTTWMTEARNHIGLREIPGKSHHPTISGWLAELKAWWRDDETPWCGTFVAHCLRSQGYLLPKHWYRARDWLNWGKSITLPVVGCIVVFERTGGGHVGFVVGQTSNGLLMVLGGNQGNEVNIRAFDRARVLGYRWPEALPMTKHQPLPIIDGKNSESEA